MIISNNFFSFSQSLSVQVTQKYEADLTLLVGQSLPTLCAEDIQIFTNNHSTGHTEATEKCYREHVSMASKPKTRQHGG